MTWEGIIPRKRRKTFEQFLHHDDPRIRTLAEEMRKEDMAERGLLRDEFELEETTADPYFLMASSDEQVNELDCETGDADDPHGISPLPF
jgi:hypothetical protein